MSRYQVTGKQCINFGLKLVAMQGLQREIQGKYVIFLKQKKMIYGLPFRADIYGGAFRKGAQKIILMRMEDIGKL